jgi:two-component system, cell cycle sensor histidine kinase and response regulator CckA
MKDMALLLDRLENENSELRLRLKEAQETLAAIRNGEVDALVVDGPRGEQVFSLKGVDHSYRILLEEMQAGAITLSVDGHILFANRFIEKMLATPLEGIIGKRIRPFIHAAAQLDFEAALLTGEKGQATVEIAMVTPAGTPIPVFLSVNQMSLDGVFTYCLAVTDLRAQKRQEQIIAEERLSRSIIDQAADVLIVCDHTGKIIRASQAAFTIAGNNCISAQFDDVFDIRINGNNDNPSELEREFEPFSIDQVIGGRSFNSREALITGKGDQARYFVLSAAPLTGDSGEIIGGTLNLTDITERIALERRVRESENWLRITLNSIGDGVIATDKRGRVALLNPVAETLTGWSENEATGKLVHEIFHMIDEVSLREVENPVDRVLREGAVVGLANHTLLISRDGKRIPITDSGALIKDDNGRLDGVVLIFRDQTHERKAQKALLESERRLSTLIGNLPGIAYRCLNDKNRTMVYISDGCKTYSGYEPNELMGRGALPYSDLILPEDRQYVLDEIQQAVTENKPFTIEYRVLDKNKHQRWFWEKGLCVDRRGSNPHVLEGFITDVTERKWAEAERRDREEYLQTILQTSVDGFWAVDSNGRITDTNPAYCRMSGYTREELLQLTISDLDAVEGPADVSRRMARIVANGSELFETRHRKKNGEIFYVEMSATCLDTGPAKFISFARDISLRKRAEAENTALQKRIHQAQKMESIGSLAGGIAHDFNNILFPIIGMAELLLEDLPIGSVERENVEEIYNAGKRGSDLVKQILAFSRQSEHKLVPTRIQKVLKEVVQLSRSAIPAYIQIEQDIQQDCGMVMADPTQIHQIGLNIITNSYHAVEETGGKISIKLKQNAIEPNDALEMNISPGVYVLLSISDNGHGISEEIIGKIFDPYFTTKEQGKGTGLGLAVVYGIVKEHKGAIKLYSEIGKGSTFEIYFPLMKKLSDTESIPETEAYQGGNERILLVDDEVSVAKLEKRVLERMGYKVTARFHSVEALEAFRSSPFSFDLVITDMSMPNIPGNELARKIKSTRADIPIIICTGFSERILEKNIKQMGIDGLLMKPIVKSELAKVVRKVLDDAKFVNQD